VGLIFQDVLEKCMSRKTERYFIFVHENVKKTYLSLKEFREKLAGLKNSSDSIENKTKDGEYDSKNISITETRCS
jgi:hypothetical protein